MIPIKKHSDWDSLIQRVTSEHVLKAIVEIKEGKHDVSPHREARKWHVKFDGRLYPSKAVLAHAVKLATGEDFPTNAKTGGRPTLDALRKILQDDRRFELVEHGG
ncbi:MAG TPA: hypothetical protein VN862_03085 [Candidatus Acidoferrales bacterium]|nr:hypothetical protein [Candidatus Acidoferrales bacterium]